MGSERSVNMPMAGWPPAESALTTGSRQKAKSRQPVDETALNISNPKCIRTDWPGIPPTEANQRCCSNRLGWERMESELKAVMEGTANALRARRHVAGEPLYRADKYVAAVGGIDEAVTFVGVDDQLRGHMAIAQGVPELV